tara:strand:+ start:10312 stop:10497 length:186 start_codon:yes stop_codon:yes gene_type:complete
MTQEEAFALARQGIKITHTYFTDEEYLTIQGNLITFEDGVKILIEDWTKGKDYLLTGWSKY